MLTPEEEKYLDEIINTASANPSVGSPYYPGATSILTQQQKPNLVEWQLDFKPELIDIKRLLRCDIEEYDKAAGRDIWQRNPDKRLVVFNDQGVNDILREIRMFLNKNTVLSNYKDEEIR